MNRTTGASLLVVFLGLVAPAGHAQEEGVGGERLAVLIETLATSGFSETMLSRYGDTDWADAMTILAARDRDDLVTAIVGAGVDPDLPNSDGSTALRSAILAEAPNAVAALVSLGADVTSKRDGLSATALAEATGNAAIVRLLGASGEISGGTRLAIAAQTGDLERIEALLADGTDVNAADAGNYTPILHAAFGGHIDAVTFLAERGGQIEAASDDGLTPLGVLVMAGSTAVVGDLLSRGANANHKMNGIPILSLAVVAGDDAMIELLLEQGADSHLESDDGATPGMLAMSLGRSELARRLGGIREPGPDMDFIAAVNVGDVDTVKRLLAAGEDPDQRADNGMPAIVIAAGNSDLPTVKALIDAGVDVMSSDRNGNNAIHAAYARSDRMTVAHYIANAIVARASGMQKLHAVLARTNNAGRSAFVRLAASTELPRHTLLDLRRPVLRVAAERPDSDGISPMLAAVLGGNTELVSRFAKIGVSFRLPSGQGTAQDLARASQSWAVLAAMPDDRVIPEGFEKGASRSARMEMQRRLREWGYYTGAIDGLLGPGSRAALTKFVLDRERELRAMAPHSKVIRQRDPVARKDGEVDYSLKAPGAGCTWSVVEWKESRSTWTDRFIGCVKGNPKWNSHGFALVRYARGDGPGDLYFFGADGWDGEVRIR